MELNQGYHGGHLLAFSGLDGPTDFDQGLVVRTSFKDTGLDIVLPGRGHVRFSTSAPRAASLTGDTFRIELSDGLARGALLDAHHLLIEGPLVSFEGDGDLARRRAGQRLLVGSAAHFNPGLIQADLDAAYRQRHHWLDSLALPQGLPAERRSVLLRALSQVKTMVYAPEGAITHRFTTPDRWPHRGMWLWDSAFHAIGLRHFDLSLAREAIEAVLDGQKPDGMVPLRTDPGPFYTEETQPPVLAFAARLVDELSPDPAWAARLYPRLAAYVRWDLAHRDSDGAGLVEWAIQGDVNCRSGESGMDNSPRFDDATRLDAVDFNAFLALEVEALAHFARSLKLDEDARGWDAIRQTLVAGINARLWNEDAGFYLDYDLDRKQPSGVLASSGFTPLAARAASPAQARRLAAHLEDLSTFGTPLQVASVAASEPHRSPDMWRGPVWVNLNWLIAYGFERYPGLEPVAHALRRQTITEIEKFALRYGTFFEFFDDRQQVDPPALLRKGSLDPDESPFHQVFFDYGWTATLYIDLVMQEYARSGRITPSQPGKIEAI